MAAKTHAAKVQAAVAISKKSGTVKKSATKASSSKSASSKSAGSKRTAPVKTSARKATAAKSASTAKKSASATKSATAKKPAGTATKSMPKGGRNPKGGLTQKGREFFAKRDGSHLKPGVTGKADTPEKMLRKGSFLVRTFTHPRGPMLDPKGQPTRLALSAHAWGEKVPKNLSEAHKLAAKGHQLLSQYHAHHGS